MVDKLNKVSVGTINTDNIKRILKKLYDTKESFRDGNPVE